MAAEGLVIDPTSEDATNVPLNMSDGTATILLEVQYPPPDIDAMYQGSIDTEGDPLVQTKHKNRTIQGRVRVTGANADALQTTLSYFQQKAGKLCREGGTLVRTAPSGDTIAFDVLWAQFDVPVSQRFININRAEVHFRFECEPYGRGGATQLADHTETTLPVLVFTEQDIKGDIPGLGRLVIDDDQGQNQLAVIWGVQSRFYSSAASAALFYQAENLTPQQGGAATSTAASGYSGTGSVLAGALQTQWQSILSSQASGFGDHWSHVGDYRVYARVNASNINSGVISIRGQWATGDGRVWTNNQITTITPGLKGNWRLIDLGPVSIPQVVAGTQRWELRVLAKSTVTGDDLHVDWLMIVPTAEGSGVAQAIIPQIDYAGYQALDEFDQTAGALAGKTPNIGGVWGGAGDSDDFSVTGSGAAQRAAVADASTSIGSGRLETMATPAALAGVNAQIDAYSSGDVGTVGQLRFGLLVRYVDANNFLAFVVEPVTDGAGRHARIDVIQRIAGSDTRISESAFIDVDYTSSTYPLQIYGSASPDGSYHAGFAQSNGPNVSVTGQSSHLATGGTLASGKVGIVDHYTSSTVMARNYLRFTATGVTADAAIMASQSLEVRHDRVIREDSGGTMWANVSRYEGDYLRVPVAGREDRQARFIVKATRGLLASGIDGGIDDISARLTYIPRYLVIPE